ncbi:MAG: hemerythrin domain-containing protein [Acidimicrobiia bacterium]
MTATLDSHDSPLSTTTAVVDPDSEVELVPYDPYKDIHKGIRAELFRVTTQAGSLDPGDRCSREQLAEDVTNLFQLLAQHAQHEDDFVQPLIEIHAPFYAEVIASDHPRLEARMQVIQGRAERATAAPAAEQRGRIHHVYRDLASFTSTYLEHQDFEECKVMPALAAVMGVDEIVAVDQAIVASIPPETMASSLSFMLPAMNIDDRAEMLGGMQAEAPPEVFAGVWALTGSVLTSADHQALGRRLGIA